MHNVEKKFHLLAPMSSIIKLEESNKDVKIKMNTEFEQFQQYLKDQNIKFSQIVTKFREMENKMKVLEQQRPIAKEESPELKDDEDRPEGLLTDKRKTLINYVSNSDFEKIVRQFSEQISLLDKNVQELFCISEVKISKDDLEYLTANKISKDELASILPSMDAQEAKLKNLVEDAMEDLQIQVA